MGRSPRSSSSSRLEKQKSKRFEIEGRRQKKIEEPISPFEESFQIQIQKYIICGECRIYHLMCHSAPAWEAVSQADSFVMNSSSQCDLSLELFFILLLKLRMIVLARYVLIDSSSRF